MLVVQHGRICRRIGNRLFAVPKTLTICDKFASASASGVKRNTWSRIDNATGRARVINNALGRAAPRRQPRFGA